LSTQNYPPQDQIVVVSPAVLVSTVVAKMPTSAIQEAAAARYVLADADVFGARGVVRANCSALKSCAWSSFFTPLWPAGKTCWQTAG